MKNLNNNNNNIYLLQLGCYLVAEVILHVRKKNDPLPHIHSRGL